MSSPETNNERPLIVTASMDHDAEASFTALRNQHFPRARNFLKAHITLFHAIPGGLLENVRDDLFSKSHGVMALKAKISDVRFLGNGVAFNVDCPPLIELQKLLASTWQSFLTPQDRQKFSPHISIQNKVPAEKARMLYEELKITAPKTEFSITGLALWHYDGGPWEADRTFPFLASKA